MNETHPHQPRSHSAGRSRDGGFTLIELLVSFTILLLILIAVLTLFDRNTRVARTQTHIADLQQAVRVSQHQLVRNIRMAGRGGMPMFQPGPVGEDPATSGYWLPRGVAVAVDNNVAANTTIAGSGSPTVAAGTDILTIRGVINGSLYQLNPTAASFGYVGGTGFVQVPALSPTGVPQDLGALCDGLRDNSTSPQPLPTALVVVSPISDQSYAVVQSTNVTGCGTGGGPPASILQVSFTTGDTHGAAYLELSPNGGFPVELTSAAFVGIVEEYRYYVRQDDDVLTDLADLVPNAAFVRRLSRARVYPNTDTPFAGAAANLQQDLADNIIDLQVALGVESSTDTDDVVTESEDSPGADEWLFNATADVSTDTCQWNGGPDAGCAGLTPNHSLYYVRITTVGRTDRPEQGWIDPAIGFIEDHNYAGDEIPSPMDSSDNRRFRRWSLTTTVDLRNLS